MKTIIKTTTLTILLTFLFTGCANNQKITIGDVVAAPIYVAYGLGYVATKGTEIAIEGTLLAGAETVNLGKKGIKTLAESTELANNSIEAKGVSND